MEKTVLLVDDETIVVVAGSRVERNIGHLRETQKGRGAESRKRFGVKPDNRRTGERSPAP